MSNKIVIVQYETTIAIVKHHFELNSMNGVWTRRINKRFLICDVGQMNSSLFHID